MLSSIYREKSFNKRFIKGYWKPRASIIFHGKTLEWFPTKSEMRQQMSSITTNLPQWVRTHVQHSKEEQMKNISSGGKIKMSLITGNMIVYRKSKEIWRQIIRMNKSIL